MDTEAMQHWKEMFYSEEWNPALCFFKRSCKWAMLNVPDASMTLGLPRYAINMLAVFGFLGVSALAFNYSHNTLELLLGMYLASWVPTLLFFKLFAAAILHGIEAYQQLARRILAVRKI